MNHPDTNGTAAVSEVVAGLWDRWGAEGWPCDARVLFARMAALSIASVRAPARFKWIVLVADALPGYDSRLEALLGFRCTKLDQGGSPCHSTNHRAH